MDDVTERIVEKIMCRIIILHAKIQYLKLKYLFALTHLHQLMIGKQTRYWTYVARKITELEKA